ncbi:enoyl-CoA hydratase/isomerase family protein [Desertimonas flava]|uniref:enoyl-CoA hydratase/isomerase family protein n=1 Tax=Desertimonas flava TaxID=2064846 RepID=UPI000E3562CF|nr:enoyl-CoA hydratase-related protein [Desertimonas flava]
MSLLFEVSDRIATITLNRPEVMNAMDPATYSELSEAWLAVRDDPEIWAAVITGAGDRAFTAGADLKQPQSAVVETWMHWQTQREQLLNRGLEVWKPVIAAVNGYCLAGGMTLLFATDIRIAATHARFGISEVKRGLLPGNGGTQRAVRQLPYPIAMELLLTGDQIDAAEALRLGLINRVVSSEELMPTAYEYARRICANGPLAVRATKELAVRSQYLHIDDGLRLEYAMAKVLAATDDAAEGRAAFADKRDPVYRAR